MPTPTGLPQKGERVEMDVLRGGVVVEMMRGVVLKRSPAGPRGQYWQLTVNWDFTDKPSIIADASYFWHRGELRFES